MNGNGKIEELLERIAASQERAEEQREATNKALVDLAVGQEQLRVGQEQLRVGQDQLRADMNAGFADVNTRIDNVLAIAGTHHDDHEQRIRMLEQRVLGGSK
jgi:hypothetical protein